MNKTATTQPAKTASFLPPSHGILQRKCACGNHTIAGGECADCAQKKMGLQRKLTIGASNDPLEQEADRIADQVMASPSHGAVSGAPVKVQRFTGNPSGQTAEVPASVERVLASPGRPLEPALRQDMEGRFGYDFSQVRVHTGKDAEHSASEMNARAYTVGNDIVFGVGQYITQSSENLHLLAHEMTHVLQQQTSVRRIMRTLWTTSSRTQPSCDYLVAGVEAEGAISLAPVEANTENCTFTPLFHVPEDRVANGQQLTIRATALSQNGRTRVPQGPHWRINVFECLDDPSRTPPYECEGDRDTNTAVGDIGNTLEVRYPGHAGWRSSSRNLFIRVRNGSPQEIRVGLEFMYPALPQPSALDQTLDVVQALVQLLGLTEPLGWVFDGLDIVISASRGRWLEAGFSVAAMVPALGQASRLLRWTSHGDEVGLRISQRVLRELPPGEIVRLIRESSEFLAHARAPHREPLQRALGLRREAIDGGLLDLALHTRTSLAGVTREALTGINVLVARVRIGDRIEYVATRSIPHAEHSEAFLFHEAERLRRAHPNEPVIVEQVFSERMPCGSGARQANCLANLEVFERAQISAHGDAGQMVVMYGVPQRGRRGRDDRFLDMQRLYGLEARASRVR